MTALNIPVQHPRLLTAGARPTTAQILTGQLAINFPDRKLYTLDNTGAIQEIGLGPGDLSTVAFTGNYNDLTNKPSAGNYVLPKASAAVLGGVMVPASGGLAVDSNGNITNAGVVSVNSRSGTVTLTAADVGLPTDLLSGPSGTVASKYLPSSITGGLSYKGNWDANANNPVLANGGVAGGTAQANGSYYVVSVAGSTSIDGISTWAVGDLALVSNNVWTKIANSGSNVTSVNGKTGTVTLTATDIAGFATVATSGNYNDLSNKPTPYSLPKATTTTLGGVQFTNTAATAGNLASGTLSTVALTGSYTDLLNQPPNPSIARLPVNVQGNPNIVNEVFYMFTDPCQFPQNWANSVANVRLISGTTATIRIMKYPAATPNTGTQVGTLNIDTVNGNSFTSTGSTTNYAAGDQLSYQFATTNVSLITITIRGTWQ
ncbi:long tail fiber [Burkholderia phage BcepSauron]|uniref:Long tail fiber n=1 Tax=Burkholderia phage BcepSauron TaxID=2530033 RepID=A0A482MKT8_9CAUD|nr:long tail fiber [Burkholderia phage BcepSauron]QBQ74661.1 long tail fiber [Burkholderia phage BcepSauron]